MQKRLISITLFLLILLPLVSSVETWKYNYLDQGERVQYGGNYTINTNYSTESGHSLTSDYATLAANSILFNDYSLFNYINGYVRAQGLVCFLSGGTDCTMTGDINMGNNAITNINYLDFNLTATPTHQEGRLHWDDNSGTLELGMPGGEVVLQLGQEMLIRARNIEETQINNGQVVYIYGAIGNVVEIGLASNTNHTTAQRSIAVATENIITNQQGYVTTSGMVRDFDTSDFNEGDYIYLAEGGNLTNIAPLPPLDKVKVGVVTRSHATEGAILVSIRAKGYLDGLSNVNSTQLINNTILQYDLLNKVWQETINPIFGNITADYFFGNGNNITNVTADNVIFRERASVDHVFEHTMNTGVMHTINVTDEGGLNISWTDGVIYDESNILIVDINANSELCTDDAVNYLVWTSGDELTLQTAKPLNGDVWVGTMHTQNGDLWMNHEQPIVAERESQIERALGSIFNVIVTEGLIISEHSGDDTWDVDLTAGVYYHDGLKKMTISAIDSTVTPITRWSHTGGDWTYDMNTQIDTAMWDNGTGLEAVAINRYYRSSFFVVGNSIHWRYPTVEYDTIAQALAGTCPDLPIGLINNPRSTCLVLRGNALAFPPSSSDQWVDVRPIIGATGTAGLISDHGELAGLNDDDHTQYLLADGTRGLTGNWAMGNHNVSIGGSDIFVDADNSRVGMGTTTPDYKLEVSGDIGFDSHVRTLHFGPSNSITYNLWEANTGSAMAIRNVGTGSLNFGVDNSIDMTILSGGNVGIGTTSPDTKLHILDNIENNYVALFQNSGNNQNRDVLKLQGGINNVLGNTKFITFADGDGTERAWIQGAKTVVNGGIAINTVSPDGSDFVIDNTGNVGIGTTTPGANLDVKGVGNVLKLTNGDTNNAIIYAGETSDIAFFKMYDDGVKTIDFQATGDSYFDSGNVGIGTTSPTYQLTVGNESNTNYSLMSAYFEGNISAAGFITRTSTYNLDKGNALSKIFNADYYEDDGIINHSKFYGGMSWETQDITRPVIETQDVETCTDVPIMETIESIQNICNYELIGQYYQNVCHDETVYTEQQKLSCDERTEEQCYYQEVYSESQYLGLEKVCNDVDIRENCTVMTIQECSTEQQEVTTYPYTKTEEGVILDAEIDMLRQALYELKFETCEKDKSKWSWCNSDGTVKNE